MTRYGGLLMTGQQMSFSSFWAGSYVIESGHADLKSASVAAAAAVIVVVFNIAREQPSWLRMTPNGFWRASLGTWEAPSGSYLSRTS